MKKLFFCALFLLFYQYSLAQFSDSTNYNLGFSSGGNINKTNDGDSYLLNNSLRFGIRKKKISLNASSSWLFGKQDKNLINNDYYASIDFNLYSKNPDLYFWGLTTYTTSLSLKINNQLQAGSGLAYNIINRKNLLFNISDGILYETNDLYLSDTIRDVYHTFRNSLRFLYKYTFKELITVEGSAFIQNSLNNHSDYIIRANNSISFKLNKWLSLNTALAYNKLNRTHRQNSLLTYGIVLNKYF